MQSLGNLPELVSFTSLSSQSQRQSESRAHHESGAPGFDDEEREDKFCTWSQESPTVSENKTPGLPLPLSPIPLRGRRRTYCWIKEMGQYVSLFPLGPGVSLYLEAPSLREKTCIPSTDGKSVLILTGNISKSIWPSHWASFSYSFLSTGDNILISIYWV